MAKSKSKGKKSSNQNNSNAKNIKALINQNKMIETQNAEAEKRKQEEAEAREQAKQARLEAEENAKLQAEQVKAVEADEVIVKDGESKPIEVTKPAEKKVEDKKQKNNKKAKKEPKPKKHRIKETVSELKKISWPSFKDVVKKTGAVLAIVIFFGVILWAFDFVLYIIHQLFLGQPIF